jgi:hypothetical protein
LHVPIIIRFVLRISFLAHYTINGYFNEIIKHLKLFTNDDDDDEDDDDDDDYGDNN